jgi:error-prone DNA polymerase
MALANAFSAWEPNRHHAAWEGLRVCGDTLPLAPSSRLPVFPSSRLLTKNDVIALDYYTTGSSIHGHPMEALRGKLREHGVKDSRDLERLRNRQTVAVAGLVVVRQRPVTAKGTLFLLLEDEHGFINVIVPDKLVDPNEKVVKQAQFMLVRGRVERQGAAISVLGAEFRKLKSSPLVHASRDFH